VRKPCWIRGGLSTLVALTLLCAATPGSAEGPLREWLKERRANKEAAPEAIATDPKAKIDKPGDYALSLEHGGLTRKYLVHVPAKYDPLKPTPLLLSFHGGGAHMEYQASDKNYGQISKSDKEGFIVVFPNGYSKLGGKLATWNAGSCCGPARDNNVDDVGFVKQMIASLGGQLNVDRDRIFATGMSNGGMMAHRLACEMSDVFKAVASVAGPDGTTNCTPSRPISVMHIHARNDDHAVFEGGSGKKSQSKSTITDFVSVPETVARWVKRDGCAATPKRVLEKPGAYCERYSQCKGNVEVALCVTETGKHSWPGAEKSRSDEPPSNAISANDVMWDFFMSR
jgi:polyhydroxybutyrate depolymerase